MRLQSAASGMNVDGIENYQPNLNMFGSNIFSSIRTGQTLEQMAMLG